MTWRGTWGGRGQTKHYISEARDNLRHMIRVVNVKEEVRVLVLVCVCVEGGGGARL